MEGIHDLGGQPGYNALGYRRDEPVFKDRWEATVFTLVRASAQAGAYTNIDQFRHAVERIDPKAAQASPLGHTRLPGYARDKRGIITACQGLWPYPDLRAHGHGEPSQYLYTVTFDSLDLGFSEAFELNLDLFEPYLYPIETTQ